MNQDFALDQGTWLGDYQYVWDAVHQRWALDTTNVVDTQRLGGVCHAMSTEWLFARLEGRAWNAATEYWRAVSHQRAYAIYWQDALRGLWGGAAYQQYLQIARGPTRDYVSNPARRQNRNFHTARLASLNFLNFHIANLGNGSGIVIVMFGVMVTPLQAGAIGPANASNWGHTVAIHRDGQGIFRFVDVNFGQYSWGPGTAGLTAGVQTRQFLQQNYGADGIRDVFLYRVG